MEHKQATAGTFAPEQPGQDLVGLIAPRDTSGVIVAVVNADDIGGDTLPSVIADDGSRPMYLTRDGGDRVVGDERLPRRQMDADA